MSEDDFKVWDADIVKEEEKIVDWINNNMSPSETGYALQRLQNVDRFIIDFQALQMKNTTEIGIYYFNYKVI